MNCCQRLCRVQQQPSLLSSATTSESLQLLDEEFTVPWAAALSATLLQAVQIAAYAKQQLMQRPDGSQRHTSTSSPLYPLMASACCVAWCQGKQAKPPGHADLQQQLTAQRVALSIAKAAQYTDEYEQVTWQRQHLFLWLLMLHLLCSQSFYDLAHLGLGSNATLCHFRNVALQVPCHTMRHFPMPGDYMHCICLTGGQHRTA